MRKLPRFALLGFVPLLLGGGALAADTEKRVMDVPLPDGSTAHIEYYGDVAPKVTIKPYVMPGFPGAWMGGSFSHFPDLGRMIGRMNRQRDAILRQMQRMPRHRSGLDATANVASYGSLPAGASSVSIVSISNGTGTCTRTTEVTSQGAGKPPKVETKVSGECRDAPGEPGSSATVQSTEPLDHT